jgi:UDP-N-acetylglucosamine 1-carboxyvinyltransferase
MAAALKAEGTTVMIETIFESRYRHVPALQSMGADIRTAGKTAVIRGVDALHGEEVLASDLRGGAALAVAALSAEGETVLRGMEHVDRGYEDMAEALTALGAEARRLEE